MKEVGEELRIKLSRNWQAICFLGIIGERLERIEKEKEEEKR